MNDVARKLVASLKDASKLANSAGDEVLELPRQVLRSMAGFRLLGPLCIAAAVGCIVVAQLGSERLQHTFDLVQRSSDLQRALFNLSAQVTDAEAAQRGFLLTGDRSYLQPYIEAEPKLQGTMARVQELIDGDPNYVDLVDAIHRDVDTKHTELRTTIALLDAGHSAEALRVVTSDRGKESGDRIRASMAQLQDHVSARVEMLAERWQSDLRFQRFAVSVSVAFSMLLVLVLLRSVRRELEWERDQSAHLDQLVRERTRELSDLASHLQRAREEEAAKLARELHDELGAIFTASRMDLAWARRKMPNLAPEIATKLQRVQEHLDQGVTLERRIIEGLVPSALTNLGLITALELLMEEFASRSGVKTQLDLIDEAPPLIQEQSVAVYRIVQEAVTNIERYAKASRVDLTVSCERGRFELCIRDNGVGMENTDLRFVRSHGLRGMKQRVMALQGEFALVSSPGNGTAITVSMPIPEGD